MEFQKEYEYTSKRIINSNKNINHLSIDIAKFWYMENSENHPIIYNIL